MSKLCPLRVHAHQVKGNVINGGNVTHALTNEHCACLEQRCALWRESKCGLIVQDSNAADAALLADELVTLSTILEQTLTAISNTLRR